MILWDAPKTPRGLTPMNRGNLGDTDEPRGLGLIRGSNMTYGILYSKKSTPKLYQKAYYLSKQIKQKLLEQKLEKIKEEIESLIVRQHQKQKLEKYLRSIAFQVLNNFTIEEMLELYKKLTPNAPKKALEYLESIAENNPHELAYVVAMRIYLNNI